MIAFGVFALFPLLAITAFGGPESYFSLAIIAFGAFDFIVPKHYCRLGKNTRRLWRNPKGTAKRGQQKKSVVNVVKLSQFFMTFGDDL